MNLAHLHRNIESYGKMDDQDLKDAGYKRMIEDDVSTLKDVAEHYEKGNFDGVARSLAHRDSAVADVVPHAILKPAGYWVRSTAKPTTDEILSRIQAANK